MPLLIAFIAAFLLAVTPPPAGGIAPRGEIALNVVERQGHPIAGATVTLLPSGAVTGHSAKTVITDASGQVRFTGLAEGQYLVRCEISGYITETLGPLPVELTKESPRLPERIDVVMPAGPIWY